ncbi:MAG: class I SAM-dependent methyltransferase [Candidatus Micrarchaeota archaeon]|nr:class I SAM-dependent methyltransferase [Candidatus Micrarchaeota archaeon]
MQNEKIQPVRKITSCRVCGNASLVPILSLGDQYVSNFVASESEQGEKIPLNIVLCEEKSGGCGLLQLEHTTPPDIMYAHYWYLSGINESMKVALADITKCVEAMIPLQAGDMVLDIGCNDGTLLRSYTKKGIKLVGIDPAKNLPKYSSVGTTKILNDYFSARTVQRHFPGEKARVVTAIAMFYDLDDPNGFVADVAGILRQDGIFVVQMSYLPLMLETNAFDNICHEHLEYYSLASLGNLLARHGLEIFDMSQNDVNGGSFRVYCRFAGSAVPQPPGAKQRLAEFVRREREMGLSGRKPYEDFSSRVQAIREKTVAFIKKERAGGKRIFVYGASTKGNTLLQTFGLDHKTIEAAAERNPDKYGKKTIGTLIPIISEDEARKLKPDYFLVLPWHFISSFVKRERGYLSSGGKFIVPLPEFRIIGSADEMG